MAVEPFKIQGIFFPTWTACHRRPQTNSKCCGLVLPQGPQFANTVALF